jgi:glycosyltransferase involved in cell wall biosynthesis
VPEVVDEGITGFIVNNVDEAVERVKQLDAIDRKLCREVFEKRFSDRRMAEDYVALYQGLIEAKSLTQKRLNYERY